MIKNTYRAIAGIAALSIRNTVRSKLFISLALLLACIVIFLPLTVKGDGSLEGRIRIILSYTLGFSSMILGAATLWVGCGAVSQEIAQKHIGLVVVKPVYRFQIWLGKWLGLLFVNFVLLLMAGAMVYVLLLWTISPVRTTDEQRYVLHRDLLVGREIISPEDEGLEEQARKRIDSMVAEGSIKKEDAHSEFLTYRAQLKSASVTVHPGTVKQWRFRMPERLADPCMFTIEFSFSTFYRNRAPVSGTWIIGRTDEPDLFHQEVSGLVSGPHRFEVPSGIYEPGEMMLVTFLNSGKSIRDTAVFDVSDGIKVSARRSGFGSNFARALLVIFCQMAVLAALGLTAGTLFYFPVATFTAISVLLTVMLSHFYISSSFFLSGNEYMGLTGEVPALLESWGIGLSRGVNFFVAPVMDIDAVELLSSGQFVSWSLAVKSVLLMVLLYPLLMGLFGAYVLKKRELALPSD